MINILFYGNCQIGAIYQTLNLNINKFKIYNIPCWTTNYDKQTFTDIVNKCDIIVTQPINDNYRDVDFLSTSYIIANSKTYSKIIICDSCHFDFYYFDLSYKHFNEKLVQQPIDYHYNKLIECYSKNLPIETYINEYINNIELKTCEELETIATNSLNELQKRYIINVNKYNNNSRISCISTHDFIKNNYKEKLLFYSMNHPTNFVIQYICEEIINILLFPNTINYTIDILSSPKCILYKCIQKNVNFNIDNHKPSTLDKQNIYEISQLYYNTYKDLNLF
jgi:hypothetical protein